MKDFLPTLRDFKGFKKSWRSDLIAGTTVGIVALPLALAFGITTGSGGTSGLITAIIAGALAALFGGSNFQVSGPTGAMTVVLVPIVSKFGVAALAPLGVAAGILVVLMGIFKSGSLINKVPWPVMEGFTFGIALVIALQQIPGALATKSIPGNGTLGTAFNTLKSAIHNHLNWRALIVVALTLTIKFSYPKIAQKFKIKIHIPASFVAIIFMTLFVNLVGFHIPKVGDLPKGIFHISKFNSGFSGAALIIPALEIALLAAIESLLSARVADNLAHHQDDFAPYSPNRELFGQGIATAISSIFGGLPATGAIARTGVNVRSGARTRFAALFHAIFLLLAVFILSPIISQIPTATLAGILIGTSFRIARPAAIREALATTKQNAIVLIFTAISILLTDLIIGIGVGIAIYIILNKFKKE